MNLIDSTYFIGEINIAQLGQQYVQEHLDNLISKYEPKYLRSVLGNAFAKLFDTGRNADSVEERWTKLISGDDYTDKHGIEQRWDGFTNEMLVSPIANYVYYWYTRDNATDTTASGEQTDTPIGAVGASPALKQSRAWNEMVAMNCRLHDFLLNKKDDNGDRVYPEFDVCKLGSNAWDFYKPINIYNL